MAQLLRHYFFLRHQSMMALTGLRHRCAIEKEAMAQNHDGLFDGSSHSPLTDFLVRGLSYELLTRTPFLTQVRIISRA